VLDDSRFFLRKDTIFFYKGKITFCIEFWAETALPFTGMRRVTKFPSTTDRIYDGGPIRLWYDII